MKKDYLRFFPKKSCYPNQMEAMDAIYDALIRRKIILFEGACGTGKTLSSLAPALSIGKKEKKTVVIATNVHQQMAQFIEEAREIKKQSDIKVVVLKGKMLMCPRENMDYDTCSLLRDNTYKLAESERDFGQLKSEMKSIRDKLKRDQDPGLIQVQRELSRELDKEEKHLHEMKKNSCDYLHKLLRSDTEDFRNWLFESVRTPEDVAVWAQEHNSCGYELLKRYMKEVDLLICNYHHFLNEDIRANVLGWLDKNIDEVITIFDEAHNIEPAARSHSSLTISEFTLKRALEEIKSNSESCSGQVRSLIEIFLDSMIKTYNIILDKKFGERERIGKDWYDLRIADPQEHIDMFREKLLNAFERSGITKAVETVEQLRSFGLIIDALYEKQFNERKSPVKKICSCLTTAQFLSNYLKPSKDMSYYPIMNVRRLNSEISGRLELYTCIPKNVTAPLLNSVHSAVLMSATMAPFETIRTTLGILRPTHELSFGLTFPEKKRLTIAVSIPALFARDRDNLHTKELITKVLTDIIEQSGGNVLIFFPSFYEAAQYSKRIQCKVPLFLDEVGVSAQRIRDEFFKIGESGKKAVLISYMWGTLTEGVDYKNGRGRTVVIVGVGYPALNDRMRAVESAYDAEFGHGWEYAVEIPTIRKVRQAMGRIVRSPDDYGVRILLDGRYTSTSVSRYGKYSVFKFFPEDERREFIEVEPERVKYSLMNFFNDIRKNYNIM